MGCGLGVCLLEERRQQMDYPRGKRIGGLARRAGACALVLAFAGVGTVHARERLPRVIVTDVESVDTTRVAAELTLELRLAVARNRAVELVYPVMTQGEDGAKRLTDAINSAPCRVADYLSASDSADVAVVAELVRRADGYLADIRLVDLTPLGCGANGLSSGCQAHGRGRSGLVMRVVDCLDTLLGAWVQANAPPARASTNTPPPETITIGIPAIDCGHADRLLEAILIRRFAEQLQRDSQFSVVILDNVEADVTRAGYFVDPPPSSAHGFADMGLVCGWDIAVYGKLGRLGKFANMALSILAIDSPDTPARSDTLFMAPSEDVLIREVVSWGNEWLAENLPTVVARQRAAAAATRAE